MHASQRIGPTPCRIGLTLVAAALVSLYGCGKEEPKQAPAAPKAAAPAAPAPPPADETVTVTIGHAGPLTGGIAHLGKDDENGVRLAVDEATAKKIKIGGKTVKFEHDERGRPGRPEARARRSRRSSSTRRSPASSAT